MPLAICGPERLTDALFDRVRLEPQTKLFWVPIGSAKTRFDTNLLYSGMMGNHDRFAIWEIRVSFLDGGVPLSLRHPLWWNSLFTLIISQRHYQILPCHICADPVAVSSYTHEELLAIQPDTRAAFVTRTPTFEFDIPLTLEQGESFSAEINTRCTEIPPDCEVMVALLGNRERGVY